MQDIRQSAMLLFVLVAAGLGLVCLTPGQAAALTITPSTWNVVGLDSNTPAFGPNRFPVGARVCGGTAGATATATFSWDGGGTDNGTYIYLRPGSNSTIEIKYVATVPTDPQYPQACADAFFEVEVEKDINAFDQTRRYHITADGLTTPTPREIYVEHLVSQARNGITDMEFGESLASLVSVANGGSMDLVKGNTYFIRMSGFTATSGYEQLESFVSFPNTIFQILDVETTYSADTTTHVSSPNPMLYGDACGWENDPNSPNYLACTDGGKNGGTIQITYQVKILSVGSGREALASLIHDFSGSSFHYNADYSTSARFANLIDPALVTLGKNFSPDPTNVGGVSALTFTISNPNWGTVSGLNFSDNLPTTPGAMTVANPPGVTMSGCGTPTFAPVSGDTILSFTNGSVAANSNCMIKVNVSTQAVGTYTNTSDHLFVSALDTGNYASDTLVVNNAPPPPVPVCGLTMANWSVPLGSTDPPDSSGGLPTTKAGDVATATAAALLPAKTAIATSGVGDTSSWSAYGFKNSGQYLDFVVDTRQYSAIFMGFDLGNPTPSNGPTSLVISYDNGGGFTNIATITNPPAAFTANALDFTGVTSTTGNTTFRLTASGAVSDQSNSNLLFDNIAFTGCAIPLPPTLTKGFTPNPVAVGAASNLAFTITNPNPNIPLTGVAFTDTLPAGLTVATGSSAQCGGTLTTTAPATLSFAGGTLATGASCVVNASVTVASNSPGPHDNVSGFVSSTESGANTGVSGVATASLLALAPPILTKEFDANPILLGDISTLTFTITNPNQGNGLSGVAFADTFPVAPGAMKVAAIPNVTTSGCGAGAFAPALVGSEATINFSGATIAAGATCMVSVDVSTPVSGQYVNTSGTVSHLINAVAAPGNTASDALLVNLANPAIALAKQVGPSSTGPWTSFLAVPTGSALYYKLTMENIGDVPLNPVSVADPLVDTSGCVWPGGGLPVAVAANEDHIASCVVGPVTALAGSHSNTATASGTYGGNVYTAQDSANYATTGLTIGKSATTSSFGSAGSTLNYQYVVANPGFAALSGPATVADDKATATCPALTTAVLSSDGTTPGDLDNFLDPGEQVTCTAAYTVTAADVTAMSITNIASATVGGATSATASLTLPKGLPSLLMVKSSQTFSDPINDQSSPKPIPGAFVDYTITVTNTGPGEVDEGTTIITDPIPADTELFVGDIDGSGPGSGPLLFTEGATASGLAYTFTSLDSTTDNLAFSGDNGVDLYGKADTAADGNGCDPTVTNIKIPLSGIFNASDGANHPSFSVKFRVRIK